MTQRPGLWLRRHRHLFAFAWAVLWVCRVEAQVTRDRSPHRAGSTVHGGARLHWLAWGTKGPAVVLLPGYSLTAHVFDDIGPRLAVDHRVIALTPRGFGESDAPDSSAYTVPTLVEDLHAVFDSLGIERAAVAGHSLSGTVAAEFALRYPGRVTHLVLLDSYPYFAAAGGDSVANLDPIAVPPFRGDTTYAAAAQYLKRYRYVPWQPAFDSDLRAKPLGAEGARRRALTADYIASQWAAPPDISRLSVPALEVCAVPTVASEYPWLRPSDREYQRAQRFVAEHLRPFSRQLCERFAATVAGGRSVELRGSHYVFFTQPAVTVQTLRGFIGQVGNPIHGVGAKALPLADWRGSLVQQMNSQEYPHRRPARAQAAPRGPG